MYVSLSCSGMLLKTYLLDAEVRASYNKGQTYIWVQVPDSLISLTQCLSYTASATMHSRSFHGSLTVCPTQETNDQRRDLLLEMLVA